MFDSNVSTFVSIVSKTETVLSAAAESINNDGLGFPPLTALAQFIISTKGKQLMVNGLKLTKVVVMWIAFLSIASVLGMTMVAAKVADWAFALWIEKGERLLEAPQIIHIITIKNDVVENLAIAAQMVLIGFEMFIEGVVKALITSLDEAAGVSVSTYV